MNKSKTKKLALLTTVAILLLALIPVANAGAPGHMKKRPGINNLSRPWFFATYYYAEFGIWPLFYPALEFSAAEDLYWRMGWATSDWEVEEDIAPRNPWMVKLFLNEEEINVQRFDVGPDKALGAKKTSYWYHVFGPGYFEAGEEYLVRWEFWVKKPYMGDDKNYWRIYVDYDGIYFPEDTEWRFEYYLNIVE